MTGVKGLGHRQRRVLAEMRKLYAEFLAARGYGLAHRAKSIGVPWRIGGSATRRAVYARALATMEKRGLLVRRRGKTRTTDVWLPPESLREY